MTKLTAHTPGTHLKKVLNMFVSPVVPSGDITADGCVRLEVDEEGSEAVDDAGGVVEAGDNDRVEGEMDEEESVGDISDMSEESLNGLNYFSINILI